MLVITGVLLCGATVAVSSAMRRRTRRQRGLALLGATERGDVDEMHRLLAAGAWVNLRNAQGWTPLHVAAAGGDSAVVSVLLEYGADVHAQSNIGITPLYNAMRLSGKHAIVDMLLAHGAQPEDQGGLAF